MSARPTEVERRSLISSPVSWPDDWLADHPGCLAGLLCNCIAGRSGGQVVPWKKVAVGKWLDSSSLAVMTLPKELWAQLVKGWLVLGLTSAAGSGDSMCSGH